MSELILGQPCPWCGGTVHDGGPVGHYCDNGLRCPGSDQLMEAQQRQDSVDAMRNFTAPKHLRKGQALFAFLSWLATADKVRKTFICYTGKTSDKNSDTHFHLGDPFDIPDEKFAALYAEFVKTKEPE